MKKWFKSLNRLASRSFGGLFSLLLGLLGGFVLGLLLGGLVLVDGFSFALFLGNGGFFSFLDLSNGLFC
jgi:hypothetical protein